MLAVEVTPRALAQIERAALWRAESRPAAPDAIRLDLAEALEVLAQQPGIGARVMWNRSIDELQLEITERSNWQPFYDDRGPAPSPGSP